MFCVEGDALTTLSWVKFMKRAGWGVSFNLLVEWSIMVRHEPYD